MNNLVNIWQIGNLNFMKSLKLQKLLVDSHHIDKITSVTNTLLLIEHPPVYTIGIRTKHYTAEDETRLIATGAEFYRTNRGGLITFHGPGQLVVYPILNLKNFKISIRCYVSQLEKTIINLCEKLGITATTSQHTGVWIGNNKVCAIGVHGSRFITSHGLALNCCTDLNWYNHIIPCGIEDKGVTSLSKELSRNISVEEVIPTFLNSFSQVFNCTCINFPNDRANDILSTVNAQNFT